MTEKQKPQEGEQQEELTMEELTKVSGGVRRTTPGKRTVTAADDWESPLKAPTLPSP